MAGLFRFRQFEVHNEASALKVGTDAVLLGAAMTIHDSDVRMLDIGTGTGVIALMAAQRSRVSLIEAVEIDGPSCDEAALNFSLSPWAGRLKAIHLPLSSFRPSGSYDLIFSNPPFYDNSLTNPDVRESQARHTERLSYREICTFSAQWLSSDGRLSLILPSEREKDLLRTAASFGLYPFRIMDIRTVAHKAPRRIIAEFCRVRQPLSRESLTLQENSARTDEYNALTESFYL